MLKCNYRLSSMHGAHAPTAGVPEADPSQDGLVVADVDCVAGVNNCNAAVYIRVERALLLTWVLTHHMWHRSSTGGRRCCQCWRIPAATPRVQQWQPS